MGEYDNVGKRRVDRPSTAGMPASAGVGPRTSSSRGQNSKQIVRAPKEWLLIGAVTLLVSYVPAIVFGTFWGYLATFAIAVAATLSALLALLEDQRRMRLPAYSLDKSFRKLGAALYGISTLVVLSVIALMAYQWAMSR